MEEYDVLLMGGVVVDGTGSKPFIADVGVKGDRIVAVGPSVRGDAKLVIDCDGLYVMPGFVDAHSHADKTLPLFPEAESYLMQGVTTTVGGSCGNTIAPVKEWWPPNMFWDLDLLYEVKPFKYYPDELVPFEEMREKVGEVYGVDLNWRRFSEFLSWLESRGISVNHAPLVGHNTVRAQVMGLEAREPTREEMEEMKEMVREAMDSGAIGLSVGLDYVPGTYAKTEELVDLVGVLREYDSSVFTIHWRRTGPRVAGARAPLEKVKGIEEAVKVCEESGVPVEISHLSPGYTIYPEPPLKLRQAAVEATLDVVNDAVARGLNVHFDVIPNVTGGTLTFKYLASLLAPWLRELGSREALARALRMRDFREEVKRAIMEGRWYYLNPSVDPYWSRYVVVKETSVREASGRTLEEIAIMRKVDPLDALFELLIEDADATVELVGRLSDEEVALLYEHERAMVGLDTYAFKPGWEMEGPPYYVPHPNTFTGTLRFLEVYVREMKAMSIEEAVRKLTSLPAGKYGLRGRGLIKPGAYADIVVLDYGILDWRSYGNPKGIIHVFVNGVQVVRDGKHTGARPGRILRRGGA